MTKVRILVIHQYYLRPGQAGGSRFNAMARMWAAAGHEVTVIAGSVDHATGRPLPGLAGRWTTRERDGDVVVWRCHIPATYGYGYAGRSLGFLGFIFSACTAALQADAPDVVIATSPPLVTPFPGWLAARTRGVPWVFEVRDLWPESAVTTGVLSARGLVTRALYRVERWACRSAATVAVLTPAFRDDLVARGLAPTDRIAFMPNAADLDRFRPAPREGAMRRELGWGDRFVVLYAGAHGRANALGQLLDAAERLRDRPDVLIATVGDGPERAGLEAEARRRGLGNIVFHGPQPKERMPEVIPACDVGAAVLQDNPTFRTVYPNKVFDYMACARPILLAIDGVARELVCAQAQAGLFASPEDGTALAGAIRALADDPAGCAAMGARGRRWVEANATREAVAARYLELLERLVAEARARRAVPAQRRSEGAGAVRLAIVSDPEER